MPGAIRWATSTGVRANYGRLYFGGSGVCLMPWNTAKTTPREKGSAMSQSVAAVYIHIVYSTKNRYPWLTDPPLRSQLYAYSATVLKNDVDSPAIIINGIADHIHILCRLSRKFAIMTVVKVCKTETAKWIKKQGPAYHDFAWQAGYGAFSVSQSNLEDVKRYIENQEHHHRQMSFQDEFRAICRKHGVEIDERYAWD
jgi:REP element-mobilizing transposase RayT